MKVSVLSYSQLLAACSAGGASVLTSVTELEPAGGWHTGVAPARYVVGRNSTFAYETRYVDEQACTAVVIDQKQSQLNRIETALMHAVSDDHPVLSRVPRVRVSYGEDRFTDLELPHRVFDGHVRAGTFEGAPVATHPRYREVRDASPANARALLEFAPTGLVFGAWDSTRRTRQSRYRSALVGEIIGVLANQGGNARENPRRGGGRVDPVGMSVQLTGKQMSAVMNDQRDELSPKLIDKIEKATKKREEKGNSGSVLGVGGIPPTLENLGVVACSRIIRTHVLSFAALRQLRFGASPAGDAACRALLAAYALAGLARSDSELYLRANCDLRESSPTVVWLDGRSGAQTELDALSIEEADRLLAEALREAEKAAGITWSGQIFEVTGNPEIGTTAIAEAADEE
ncbi:type I-U CRISPR-associated protein Cas7 [Nocardia transvalensis]|nr:type I-U CRISPR-associated protein Cas7 [Nocardia transvalensis]